MSGRGCLVTSEQSSPGIMYKSTCCQLLFHYHTKEFGTLELIGINLYIGINQEGSTATHWIINWPTRCLLSGALVFNPNSFPCVVWQNQNCITFAKTMVPVNIFFIAKKWLLHLRNLMSATSKQLSNSPISQPFDCPQTLFHQEVSNKGLPGLS